MGILLLDGHFDKGGLRPYLRRACRTWRLPERKSAGCVQGRHKLQPVRMQQMVIACQGLSTYPDGRRAGKERVDFLHRFQATMLVDSMRQRQRNQSWLQVLAGILEFVYGEVGSQVIDVPPRLLHDIGKGQQP